MASVPTERTAMAASPCSRAFCPVRSSRMAAATVTGSTSSISSVRSRTDATASAPKATWLSPSPMKEKRLSTSVTPNREAHSAISTPTTSA